MKKMFSSAFALMLAMSIFAGCAQNNEKGSAQENEAPAGQEKEQVTLTIGASPVPHAEILKQVEPLLEKEGITLDIKEFTDYTLPNQALNDGQLDANFFQHTPYLESFNKEHGTKVVPSVAVHFEPIGVYAGKSKSLDDVKEGATFAVPNDPTNEARALQLLQSQKLITLPESAGLDVTAKDIQDNPKKIVIKEFDAAMIPRMLGEVDFAIINGNYAIDAGLKVKDALVAEDVNSLAAKTYANILAVREGENREAIKKLETALQSPEVKKFIEEKYEGSVVPMF